MYKLHRIIVVVFFVFVAIIATKAESEYANDYLLLNGHEELVTMGMDTTYNWWAMTSPFTKKFRLIVNGIESKAYDKISKPLFSPDGGRWASFADANGSIQILTENSVIDLPSATAFGEMVWSANSEVLVYSYFESVNEIIVTRNREIEVRNRIGTLFTNYNGSKIAFLGSRVGSMVLNVNGKETTIYDEIKPFGFWHNGNFIYAVRSGYRWEIMKGDKSLDDTYTNVIEGKVNMAGDVAAFLITGYDTKSRSILLSDDYYEPLVGKGYDYAIALDLHPYLALYAYKARYRENYYIVYSSTEYYAGTAASDPFFSADGNDLSFVYQTSLNSYFNNNGERGYFPDGSNITDPVAHATGSNTYAFSSGISLIMRYTSTRRFEQSSLVNATTYARYNRIDKRYECLGATNNRLYLLTLDVPDVY